MKHNLLIFSAIVAFLLAVAIWLELFAHGGWERQHQMDTVAAITGGDPARGYHVMTRVGCGGCHTIPGIPGAQGKVGPNLKEFKDRAFIAGILANNKTNLIPWLQHPREYDARSAMPDLGLTEAEARDIAAYLYGGF